MHLTLNKPDRDRQAGIQAKCLWGPVNLEREFFRLLNEGLNLERGSQGFE